MTYAAEHDFLTDLPNRLLFNDRVNQAIASALRHGKLVAVLFLDLDEFKQINDSMGHSARRQASSIRRKSPTGLRARLRYSQPTRQRRVRGAPFRGGASRRAAIIATRMLDAVAEVHFVDRYELRVTTSIGVAVYPADGLDAATLIKNADTAMYQAKTNVHNNTSFFWPAMRALEPKLVWPTAV